MKKVTAIELIEDVKGIYRMSAHEYLQEIVKNFTDGDISFIIDFKREISIHDVNEKKEQKTSERNGRTFPERVLDFLVRHWVRNPLEAEGVNIEDVKTDADETFQFFELVEVKENEEDGWRLRRYAGEDRDCLPDGNTKEIYARPISWKYIRKVQLW